MSIDNQLFSGDESNRWEDEQNNVFGIIAAQNILEQDAAANLDDPVEEVQEFEHLLSNIDGGEGNPDDASEQVDEYESVVVTLKTNTLTELKDMCKILKIGSSGSKKVVFERIRDCGNVLIEKVDNESFVYKKKKEGVNQLLPRWVILNPEPVPPIVGIDMLRGAEAGFFGPTNRENAVGAPKYQYCVQEGEKIVRPEFASKDPSCPALDKGHLSKTARDLLPEKISHCRPKHFFDTQISPNFVKSCIVNTTNARAAAEGAGFGGTQYTDYTQFDSDEVYRMIGLLFVNGVCPRPSFTMWFERHNIFGNEFIAKAMDKHIPGGHRSVRGIRRWKHFRRFMCMFDFRENAKKETEKNPLWKVQRFLDEINDNAAKMWIPGKWVAIDEQTLGFQGRSGIKLRITYKNEGDGFQCDAICDSGYTFSFFFRHGDPPTLPNDFSKNIPDLSPTARRVVWLALRLPNVWTRIFMDNLFNSRKLFTALFMAKALGHGVVRTTGRGLPPSVRQLEEKNVKEAQKLRGRTAAARLVNSIDCLDLFACLVYVTRRFTCSPLSRKACTGL